MADILVKLGIKSGKDFVTTRSGYVINKSFFVKVDDDDKDVRWLIANNPHIEIRDVSEVGGTEEVKPEEEAKKEKEVKPEEEAKKGKKAKKNKHKFIDNIHMKNIIKPSVKDIDNLIIA